MWRYVAFFFLILVCTPACKHKAEDILVDIKKKYKEINDKLKNYKTKTVDDITNGGGGTITGYYRDEEVKKVIAEHFTDTCRTFTEYYFDDGMLIFILKQNFVYNCPIYYTQEVARRKNDSVWYDDKKTRMEISKFYFNKNILIRWVDMNDIFIIDRTPEFIDKESELWGETAILLKQLKGAVPGS